MQRLRTPATEISPTLWLGVPLGVAALVVGCATLVPELYVRAFRSELGLVELGTPVAVLVGVYLALATLRIEPPASGGAVRAWLVLFVLGGIYFAGEELSWGQHLFGWSTPEPFAAINDQNETNLHNTSSWLDQKPKWAMRYAALVGGVLAPAVLAYLGAPRRWTFVRWVWPTHVCMPAALLALVCALTGRVDPEAIPGGLGQMLRVSELEELSHGLFLMVYAASLRTRLRAGQDVTGAGGADPIGSGPGAR